MTYLIGNERHLPRKIRQRLVDEAQVSYDRQEAA